MEPRFRELRCGHGPARAKNTLDPNTSTPDEITFSEVGQDVPTDATYLFVLVDLTSEAEGDLQPTLNASSDLALDQGTISNDEGEFPLVLSSSSAPLPVELTGFEARINEGNVVLTWQTASETNNSGFSVQRRPAADSTNPDWETIDRVEGHGTTDQAQQYRSTDSDLPYAADRLTYRLRQVDTDGTHSYSGTRTVELQGPERVTLRSPYPNPVREHVTLRYGLPEPADVSIQVYDVMGRQVSTFQRGAEAAGRKELQMPASRLSAGTYFVRLQAGATVRTKQITVVE